MLEGITSFFKKVFKGDAEKEGSNSKNAAKERLHLVLMQDRANVSADFLELMKQEIIDVIKKYIVVDDNAIDVRLTNQANDDGTNGAPALYANIPILNIRNDVKAEQIKENTMNSTENKEESKEVKDKEEKENTEETITKENEDNTKIENETVDTEEEKEDNEDSEIDAIEETEVGEDTEKE